jgi:hypothetical protein
LSEDGLDKQTAQCQEIVPDTNGLHFEKPVGLEDSASGKKEETEPISSWAANQTPQFQDIVPDTRSPIIERTADAEAPGSEKKEKADLVSSWVADQTVQVQETVPETNGHHLEKAAEAEDSASENKEKNDPISSWAANQTARVQGIVPETYSPIIERITEPEASESVKEITDPIGYWTSNLTWPNNFAEPNMSSSNNSNKRQRTSDLSQSGKDDKSRSYSQSRKEGSVPQPYSKSYEKWISVNGLDMDDFKGEELVSSSSKVTCNDLQNITREVISPTVYTDTEILEVIKLCRNRNEATVNRDVTPLILPPIKLLYLKNKDKENQFQHFTDEVNTQWHESWVLAGPRPKPDLAVGFFSSAFTIAENAKLTNYTSFENLTRSTDDLCFPFLMCEVKCGNEGLDYADRQNMHSCSVAVKALLRLEHKADQYRDDKKFESLLGKVLVYSISHDQKLARVYGHYALVEGEKWTYYRYHIANYDILYKERDLLAIHNFARNVITMYGPKLLKQIQDAIAALPTTSTLSFPAGAMSLGSQQISQQPSQAGDPEGFATPILPASAQKLFDEQKKQMDEQKKQMDQQKKQMDKLLEQLEEQRKDNKEQMERQRKDHKEQMERLLQQLEQQRKD